MNLTGFALRNTPLVVVVVGALAAFGLSVVTSFPSQEDPPILVREAVVTTYSPGMPPEKVERLISREIEKALARVSNDYEAHYYLGMARMELGQGREARTALERSQSYGTFRSPSLITLAGLSARAGDTARALELLEQAAEAGARLAVLPENFAAMGRSDLPRLGRAEAAGDGPILPWLKQVARDLRLWIVAGTLPLPPDDDPQGKTNACSLLFDDQGQRVARYDKLHLFDA